jgi:hypothetical protein
VCAYTQTYKNIHSYWLVLLTAFLAHAASECVFAMFIEFTAAAGKNTFHLYLLAVARPPYGHSVGTTITFANHIVAG